MKALTSIRLYSLAAAIAAAGASSCCAHRQGGAERSPDSGPAERDSSCLRYPTNVLPAPGADQVSAWAHEPLEILESHDRRHVVFSDGLGRVFVWRPTAPTEPVVLPAPGVVVGLSRSGALYVLDLRAGRVRRVLLSTGTQWDSTLTTRILPGGLAAIIDSEGRYVLTVEKWRDGSRILIADDCMFDGTPNHECHPSHAFDVLAPGFDRRAYDLDYREIVPPRRAKIRPGLGQFFRVVAHVPEDEIQLGNLVGDRVVTIERRPGSAESKVVIRSVRDGREIARWALRHDHAAVVRDRVIQWADVGGQMQISDLGGAVLRALDLTPAAQPGTDPRCTKYITEASPAALLVEHTCGNLTTAPRLQLLDVAKGRVVWGSNDPGVITASVRRNGTVLVATRRGICSAKAY